MIREHDSVVLTRELPAAGLVAGDVGVVVHVYREGEAFEVEFVSYGGRTLSVETLEAASVRRVGTRDVPHVREMAVCDLAKTRGVERAPSWSRSDWRRPPRDLT
jgi:hypothetical protein